MYVLHLARSKHLEILYHNSLRVFCTAHTDTLHQSYHVSHKSLANRLLRNPIILVLAFN